jgi:hypothetical protein
MISEWFLSPKILQMFLLDDNARFGWIEEEDEIEQFPIVPPAPYLMGASQVQITTEISERVRVMIRLMHDSLSPTSRLNYNYNMNQARTLMRKCRERGREDLREILVYAYEKVSFTKSHPQH